MREPTNVADHLRSLEEQLLSPQTRSSPEIVGELLAEDFVEFGSSGRVWRKQEIVDALQTETAIRRTMSDFRTRQLADDVVLVTYRVSRQDESAGAPFATLRSSIWKFDGCWRMLFHQGTVANF